MAHHTQHSAAHGAGHHAAHAADHPAHPHGQDKAARYDRQLRLWGEDGQVRVEAAKVLLLGATATGAETLKNLVLPGIGSFTIVDGKKVEAADLGNNFFVTADSLGQPRAKVVTALLQELNEFVRGQWVDEDPVHLLDRSPAFVADYTHVVAAGLPEAAVRKLAGVCWAAHIPLVWVRTYGLLGYLRLAVDEHRVVESKRENVPEDLRIFNPFPELRAFAASFDLAALPNDRHAHVPYPVLLIQALDKWRAEHGGKAPASSAEKTAFKAEVKKMARTFGQENVEEALKAANKYCWGPLPLRPELAALLADPKVDHADLGTPYWLLLAALRDFIATEGAGSLPQAGAVPDMHADTNSFIALQKVYQERAGRDLAAMVARVNALSSKAAAAGRHPALAEEEVRTFCKNAQYLQVLRYSPLDAELALSAETKAALRAAQQDDVAGGVQWYVLLRAVERFQAAHSRLPGAFDDEVEADVPRLKALAAALAQELELDAATVSDDAVHEVCRWGGAELHSMASFMGGVAAQEVIKLVTHKWVPMHSTFLYNGIHSTAARFSL